MSSKLAIGIVVYVFAINVLAYYSMVLDKAKAQNGLRRISEATLLNLAILGGSVGTIVAQRTARHKTRKEPFRSQLGAIIILQIAVLIAAGAGVALTGSPEALWQLVASWLFEVRR